MPIEHRARYLGLAAHDERVRSRHKRLELFARLSSGFVDLEPAAAQHGKTALGKRFGHDHDAFRAPALCVAHLLAR